MVMTVLNWPDVGDTAEIAPASAYDQTLSADTMAPESATNMASPAPTVSDAAAITWTTASSSSTMVSTSTPARVTETTSLPPPRRLAPLIVTRVLYWPCVGLNDAITPSVS